MSGWDEYKKTMAMPMDLGAAAKTNDVATLDRLLDRGASIDERDVRGYSPLMLAAYSGHVEAFDLLLDRGADPNSEDLAGNSVLMGAAFKGHAYMVERLIGRGADVTARNRAGLDAKGFATTFGRHGIVALIDRLCASDETRDTPAASPG